MSRRTGALAAWCLGTVTGLGPVACGGPPEVIREVPTAQTVTKEDPGGDATDPHQAALLRLLHEPFTTQTDKADTLRVQLADGPHWRRVRFWGYRTRAGFRYGDGHYAVGALDYSEAEPDDTVETCLERFVRRARRLGKAFQLELGPPKLELGLHQVRASVLTPAPRMPDSAPDAEPEQRRVDKPMPVVRAEGTVATIGGGRWLGAAASYHAWPGRCLVQAFAVDAEAYPELAAAVVDRWVREGAGRLVWARSLWEAPPIEDR